MMCKKKWSAIVLTISASSSQILSAAPYVSDQAGANGFVEDSKLNVLLRNYYWNRNGMGGRGDTRDWTQGVHVLFNSGYTRGSVGVGVDSFFYGGYLLSGQDKYAGSGNMTLDDGRNNSEFGKAGAAVKFRVSKTTVKIGDQLPSVNPVFAIGSTYLVPQTASGINIQSSEIDGLDLDGGHFYSSTSQSTTARGGELWALNAGVTTRTADYFGGRYKPSSNWEFGLYGSQYEDLWNQYYASASYSTPLSVEQSLAFDFNYYRTTDEGSKKAGDIDNNTFSLQGTYRYLAHSFSLAYQKVDGNTPFDYIAAGGEAGHAGAKKSGNSIFLSNSVMISDFNGPHEASWKAMYNLDMASYGIPGLTFRVRYLYGEHADGRHIPANSAYLANGFGSDGRHFETDLDLKYVFQSGPAKNLSVLLRQGWHRSNNDYAQASSSAFRLIVEYPVSIF